jgi:hypothetical protein
MTTAYCVLYPAEGLSFSSTTEILNFDVPSGFITPHEYGLYTANLSFTRKIKDLETIVTGSLANSRGAPLSFVIISSHDEIGYVPPPLGSPLKIERPPDCYIGQNCPFIITYKNENGQQLIYNLLFTHGDTPESSIINVRGNVCIPERASVPFPNPCPGLASPVIGEIWLSNDRQMISQVNYKTTETFDGCNASVNLASRHLQAKCCNCGLVKREIEYTQYHVNIQNVMKGKGCTILQRFESIISHGHGGDYDCFLQYAILRLAISGLLYNSNTFNLDWLLRSSNKQFKKSLATSQYAEKYYDYFFDSEASRYWRFFKP